jgi:ribosome-binding ATPase YchF (GTP1/OBG family)
MLERLRKFLEDGNMAKTFETNDEDEAALFESYTLLTAKPVIYAANVAEDDIADDGATNPHVHCRKRLRSQGRKSGICCFSAEMEAEISELEDDERQMFLEDLGMKGIGTG